MRPYVPGPEGAESTDGEGRSGVQTVRRSGLLTVLLSVWLL